MKVILLAGGLGTRISEETSHKPKPMVELAGKPILLHIMMIYARQINAEFIVATGYKSEIIENYLNSKTFKSEGLKASALFTGEDTSTGGRIKKVLEVNKDEKFMATYGDGVCDLDLKKLLNFHESHGKISTVTAVRPAARFGRLEINDDGQVSSFSEKSQAQEGWINGGFFVFNRKIEKYLPNYSEPFEHAPLSELSKSKELMAYKHHGFWQPMDTLREKADLENLVLANMAPWINNLK